jgi:hypothetical protein
MGERTAGGLRNEDRTGRGLSLVALGPDAFPIRESDEEFQRAIVPTSSVYLACRASQFRGDSAVGLL